MASGTRRKFQLMVPNKDILPGVDNLVFEYKPSHPTLQLGQVISLGLGLNKPKDVSKNYVYAPKPAQASETAYYFQVLREDFDDLFVPQVRDSSSSVFISVSLVKDLINGENKDWTQECPNIFSMDMHAAAEKNWIQNAKPTSAKETKLTHLDVWVRDKNGKLIEETETLRVETDGSAAPFWLKWVKKKFSIPGKGGRPPRSTNFELTEPLYIVPVTQVDRLLTALEECVDLVNLDNGADHLMLSKTAPNPLHYMLMSIDPFGIFRTYIHVNDWDAWMDKVGSKATSKPNSIRDFVFNGNPTMNKCCDGIAKEYDKIFNAKENGHAPNKPTTLSKKQKAQALSKRFHARFSPKGNIEPHENAVGMQVYLDAQKILDTVNKRTGEDSQKTVMGNVSAPEIADSLDWAKEMIIFSNAEWLHLSGFAYGGFMMTGAESGWSTSQNPLNLVFGTSETNSLMTRYEAAWQSFILYEYELQKMSNIVQLVATKQEYPHKMPRIISSDGQLLIRTNVPEVDLEYDYYDITGAQRYKRKRFPLWDEEKAQAQRNDFTQVPRGALSDADMRQSATDYFFIAHTIEYSLVFGHTSRLLKRRGFQQTVYFYPFSRPLLHKFETDLDRKLLAHLYRSAKQDLVEDWNDLGPIKTPGSKTTKSGKKGKPSGSKTMTKAARKAAEKNNLKKRVAESDVRYADFEGYGDFQQLISDLNLGVLGDFDNFQDMKTITDFGDFGPSANGDSSDLGDVEGNEEDGEEDAEGGENGGTNKRRLLGKSVMDSLYNRLELWNAKGKKDQERKLGEL
ncbi:hypothetical protein LCI18_006828 [Fusarium solani-melongenae]|uniref:Uncharacterized protein n=1 Tax=Fusarium solani subsp. cucurbitae TaxID=2747967 RepID=A0ACD3Z495_FUSSC|nr:hypothetical protein LCI18_006828 [Fusarium solani-melongenae]